MTVKPDTNVLVFLGVLLSLSGGVIFASGAVFMIEIPVLDILAPIILTFLLIVGYLVLFLTSVFTSYSFYDNTVVINSGVFFRKTVYFYLNRTSEVRYIKLPFSGVVTILRNSKGYVLLLTEYRLKEKN